MVLCCPVKYIPKVKIRILHDSDEDEVCKGIPCLSFRGSCFEILLCHPTYHVRNQIVRYNKQIKSNSKSLMTQEICWFELFPWHSLFLHTPRVSVYVEYSRCGHAPMSGAICSAGLGPCLALATLGHAMPYNVSAAAHRVVSPLTVGVQAGSG